MRNGHQFVTSIIRLAQQIKVSLITELIKTLIIR